MTNGPDENPGRFVLALTLSVMAGLVPAIHVFLRAWPTHGCAGEAPRMTEHDHSLRDHRIEIVPIRIVDHDPTNFPSTRPVLDIVFALDGIANVFIALEID